MTHAQLLPGWLLIASMLVGAPMILANRRIALAITKLVERGAGTAIDTRWWTLGLRLLNYGGGAAMILFPVGFLLAGQTAW